MSIKTFTKKYWRIGLECALPIVVGIALALLIHVVFGEEFETRQQARIYAPVAGEEYGEGRRDDIRVVLIDDAALAAADQLWPARYGYSARLLSGIAQYHPKAVMVDVYYGAKRDDPSLPALLRSVCALHDQGVPLFLAAVRGNDGDYRLRPELDALAGHCFEKVAIQYQPDDIDHLAWTYPLAVHDGAHAAAGAHAHAPKSAALALYEVDHAPLEVGHHPLALTWGSRPAAHGLDWMRETEHGPRPYCRAPQGWRELLPSGLHKLLDDDADLPVCVFHETLSAAAFFHPSEADRARLQATLAGKIVLVGVAHGESNDFVTSSLHGRIPGVYLHAMALDNLLAQGERYTREIHFGLHRDAWPMMALLAGAMLLLVVLPKTVFPRVCAWAIARRPRWVRARHDALTARVSWRPSPRIRHYVVRPMALLVLRLARLVLIALIGYALVSLGGRLGLGFMAVVTVIFLTLLGEWFELAEHLFHYLVPDHDAHPHDFTHKESTDVQHKQNEPA